MDGGRGDDSNIDGGAGNGDLIYGGDDDDVLWGPEGTMFGEFVNHDGGPGFDSCSNGFNTELDCQTFPDWTNPANVPAVCP